MPIPQADIGAGTTPVPLSNPVQGLQPETVYHYRVLARNALGQESGAEQTFTTSATGEFVLPDDRQWQMVSPPQKQGSLIEPIGEGFVIQAAADGHAFTYVADAPIEAGPAGYAGEAQVFSARGRMGGRAANSRFRTNRTPACRSGVLASIPSSRAISHRPWCSRSGT